MPSKSTAALWLKTMSGSGGGWLRLGTLLPLVSGLLLLPQAYLLAQVLHGAIIERQQLHMLWLPIGLAGTILVLRIGLNLIAEQAAVRGGEAIKLALRQRLMAQLLSPVPEGERRAGAKASTLIDQVEALEGYFVRYLPAMAQAVVLPLAFALAVAPVDWVVATLFLVTAPLIPLFMALAGLGAEAASKAQASALAQLSARFADRLSGLVTLKLLGRAEAETAAIGAASQELGRRTMMVMRIAFLSSAVLEFFAALGVAGTALYIGLSLLQLIAVPATGLTLATGLFCLLMAPEIYQPLRLLAAHYHDRAAALAAADAILATFTDKPAEPLLRPLPAVPHSGAPVRLTLMGAGVGTGPDGIDLELAPGRHIAIMGPSGIGKSSLLDAIVRLRPHRGSIALDGQALDQIEEAALRGRVGVLRQKPHIFAGTMADNIRLGRPDACDTNVRLAAQRARVTAFAHGLPDGLQTALGENGLGLSGGEVQRLALARLYLRDPGLVLLDEPTAHLDAQTEASVLDGLTAWAKGRTMIVVTHSPAVAARMDRVYRLTGNGLIVALRPAPLTHKDVAA